VTLWRQPDHEDVEDLLRFAKELRGKYLGDLIRQSTEGHDDLSLTVGKGGVGNAVQHFFGLDLNDTRPESDFPHAGAGLGNKKGLELKVVPLTRRSKKGGFRVKERQVIGMINYNGIQDEHWDESKAREKMHRILNVFYEHQKDRSASRIIDAGIWSIEDRMENVLQRDWETCQDVVCDGRAHELSERMFTTLSANTKGAGKGRDFVEYHGGLEKAKRRSFSLKSGYMQSVWENQNGQRVITHAVIDHLVTENVDEAIRGRLRALTGLTVVQTAKKLGIQLSKAKDAVSRIARHWLSGKPNAKMIHELDERGLQLRTVPVKGDDMRPWEATSFPAISIMDLVNCESFEDHSLSQHLTGIVFLPCIRPGRRTPREEIVFGEPIVWRPSVEEWTKIAEEWEMYRDFIKEHGVGGGLPRASETTIIHMRPKARDSSDRDEGPHGETITRQAFWLNQSFVQSLFQRAIE